MFPPDLVHVLLGRVLVASVPRGDVELEVKAGVLEVVNVGQLVRNVIVQGHGGLVNPAVSSHHYQLQTQLTYIELASRFLTCFWCKIIDLNPSSCQCQCR